MYNYCAIEGNLCYKNELKTNEKGTIYLRNCVASQDAYGAYFFYFVVFGGLAESVAKYTDVGARVIVSGKLTHSKNESRVENRKYSIIANDVRFL